MSSGDSSVGATLIKGIRRPIAVNYDGQNITWKSWIRKAGFSFLDIRQDIYDQFFHFMENEIPDNYSKDPKDAHFKENDTSIMIFLNQSLSGEAAKIMDSIGCLPGESNYLPFPGSRIIMKLKSEYGVSSAIDAMDILTQFNNLQYTSAVEFTSEVDLLNSTFKELTGYEFMDVIIQGKILQHMSDAGLYESIVREYAPLKRNSGKTWRTLVAEIRVLEKFAKISKGSSASSPNTLLTSKPPTAISKVAIKKVFVPCSTCVLKFKGQGRNIPVTHTSERCFQLHPELKPVSLLTGNNTQLISSSSYIQSAKHCFMTADNVTATDSNAFASTLDCIMFDTCANVVLINPDSRNIVISNVTNVVSTPITGANSSILGSLNPKQMADVTFSVKNQNNKETVINIKGAFLDKSLKYNIVPTKRFTGKPGNSYIESTDSNNITTGILTLSNDKITIHTEKGLAYLKIENLKSVLLNQSKRVLSEDETYRLHQSIGHLNYRDLKEYVKDEYTIPTAMPPCTVCQINKGIKESVLPYTNHVCKAPGELFYLDLSGRSAYPSVSGNYYVLGIRDDFSGKLLGRVLKSTNQTGNEIPSLKIEFNSIGIVMGLNTVFRCDQDVAAFKSPQFLNVCKSLCIYVTYSPPYMHNYMGKIERSWYTIYNMAACMYSDSPNVLPKSLWTSVVLYAIFVHGNTPKNNVSGKAPNKILKLKDDRTIYRYGITVVDLINTHHSKFEPRSRLSIFIGYSNDSKCAFLYHPDSKRITQSINFKVANRDLVILPNTNNTNTQDIKSLLHVYMTHVLYLLYFPLLYLLLLCQLHIFLV